MSKAKCPYCRNKLSAHKGNTKTFDDLSKAEKANSIKAMTFNLKRAVLKTSDTEKRLDWIKKYLDKK